MIRDRIKELRRVRASELKPHPKNWRTHSDDQRDALIGVLDEVGLAGAVIARELADGSLQLIDGHLRSEVSGDAEVPVLVVDLTDEEADKVLLTHDVLTYMAGFDTQQLGKLLAGVQTNNDQLSVFIARLARENRSAADPPAVNQPEIDVPQLWNVVVECTDESQQRVVYEQLATAGHTCRLITI